MPQPLGYFRFGLLDWIRDAGSSEFLGSRRNLSGYLHRIPAPAFDDIAALLPLRRGPILRLPQSPYRLKELLVACLVSNEYLRSAGGVHDTPPRLSLSAGLTGLPAAAMTAPTFSVAARRGSWNRCA